MISSKWLLRIAGAQTVLILILSAALFFTSPFTGEVQTTVDSTRSVSADTTKSLTDIQWFLSGAQPSDTLQEATTDTVFTCPTTLAGMKPTMRDSVKHDTVYVSKTQPLLSYNRTITQPRINGTITSVVQGELLQQTVDLSVQKWTIDRTVTHRISRRTTRIQRPRLEVLGAGSVAANAAYLDAYVGGGVRFPGKFSVVYQVNPFVMKHQVTLLRPLFSL
jgi:hypothetical protein